MIYVNKNRSLETLEELIEQNIQTRVDYLPEEFNVQQQMALELFKKRIFLEKTIDEAIAFNKKFVFDDSNENLKLTTTAEDLVDVFKLRSSVYYDIGYQNELPDTIEGLNFDIFDSNSVLLNYKNNGVTTGTVRCVIDSEKLLPSEEKSSFNQIRKEHKLIGELSRLVIKHQSKGLSLEFKYIFGGIYKLFMNNDIDLLLTVIKKEHHKLYSKFGGVDLVKELESYGHLDQTSLVLSWDPSQATKFFQRSFL